MAKGDRGILVFMTTTAGPWKGVSLFLSSWGGASLELTHASETKIRFRFQVMIPKSFGARGRLLRLGEGDKCSRGTRAGKPVKTELSRPSTEKMLP